MNTADKFRAPILVFAPIGRDATASAEMLKRVGVAAEVCKDFDMLVSKLGEHVGAVFVAEEGLFGRDLTTLQSIIGGQPAWSDLPFIMLTSHEAQQGIALWRQKVAETLRNVALLERPIHPMTLRSAVKVALRARSRQFEVRGLLMERDRTAETLERLVAERTKDLAAANGELRAHMEERARVEAVLRQAQKMEAIGQLTGGVAHDFNNLLMVISGGLDMLDRSTDPGRREKLIDAMKQAAQRGAGLTRQLLAFSRRQESKRKSVDLRLQIGGMKELLERSLRGNVHVEMQFVDGVWAVEVDPGELELAILNLAVNARDAMPKGGTISISATNAPNLTEPDIQGDFVRLSVGDSGVGMSPEVKERVFEPFYTTKEIGQGSGLGLAQVYGFAKQSGGTVSIETEVGTGTTVNLFLPKSEAAPSAESVHTVDLARSPPSVDVAVNVLLVEDDDEVAALVSEMLAQLGYTVMRVAGGAAALGALANDRKIDVVFSDIMMPGGINGIELARELRVRRPGLPVLLTSGYAEASQRDADAEGISILSKPYQVEDLARALSQAVRGI
ncbi:ATP-binding protein [Aestuariivirga sp.]|uniref:ATP-binding protein n=1 Tax=Aestuariivirga sp. TaxID=2650926 RepID=UPI00391DF9E0